MLITSLYAGLLGLFYLVLTARVGLARKTYKVLLGDGGQNDLALRIRVHGNFIEYVPLALVLMMAIEIQGAPQFVLYGVGTALVLGRVLHAIGLTRANLRLRMTGMFLSLGAIAVASVMAIILCFYNSGF